ncbi:MAG: WbqC family protein [Zoogloeaceae bacterium]|nr:WbqC family protein [Zoogloeaceae bacterium]
MSLVAIHQPNFFPWLGYFDKIRRADIFIFLDDVQYPKKGGSWSNRVKVLINSEGHWLTAPVDRSFHGTRAINEMYFSGEEDWRGKVLKTLIAAYRRAPYFEEAFSILEPLIRHSDDNVAGYNVHATVTLAGAIGLSVDSFVRSSSLQVGSTATQRLIDLTRQVGGQFYLCGGGASGYQEDEAFARNGLSLVYQQFVPEPYPQYGMATFLPGLSIIDRAMNLGWMGVGQQFQGTE